MQTSRHTRKSLLLLAETCGIFAAIAGLALAALTALPPPAAWCALLLLALGQGLRFDRLKALARTPAGLRLLRLVERVAA